MRNVRRKRQIIMGIFSLALIAGIFAAALRQDDSGRREQTEKAAEPQVSISFSPEELVYDGKSSLNLMDGVKALTAAGEDVTSEVSAVLTGRGSKTERIVRYNVFDSSGVEISARRKLILEGYQEPSITLKNISPVYAEELPDFIRVLKERGELTVLDGFGRDIADKVNWVREKISDGRYRIEFQVTNQLHDTAAAETEMEIIGATDDLILTLSSDREELTRGAAFEPLLYVAKAGDSAGNDLIGKVQVTGTVNTDVPGEYLVRYLLLSADRTQKAEAYLNVRILP